MTESVLVPDASGLRPLESRGFTFRDGLAGLLVRREDGEFAAYVNRCPHWNVDLDMGLGDFVDPHTKTIVCRNHAAEFVVETGICLVGPCAGERLVPLAVRVVDGDVFVGRALP